MNYAVIRNILGKILILLAILMILPLIVSFIYQEGITHYLAYIIPIVLLITFGILLNLKKAKNPKMQVREGMIIVGSSWLIMSLFGCVPFMISGEIPNFFDAFFEMASGFTTTGASIITDVTKISHSIHFWRCFSHWIGGMGVLVFILAIIPESRDGSALHILRAESPGPQVGRLVSKMQSSSRILYIIYMVLTFVEFLLLWLGPDSKMNLFNSIIYSLGTAGTGGFSAHAAGFAEFSKYSQYVVSIFMLIFGINFTMFYLLLIRNVKEIGKNDELKVYGIIVVISVAIICANIYPLYKNFEESFRLSLFQVAAIISTTGFSSANFDNWPALSKTIIIIIMCFGACAGSTAGGLKLSRATILFKSAVSKVKKLVHPRKVETIYMDGKPLSDATIETVQGYFVVYMMIFIVCTILISLYNPNIKELDLVTCFTSSLTCISNVGPALGPIAGPTGNFAAFSSFSKFILSIEMIVGRLELFPILLLFSPNTWKKRY